MKKISFIGLIALALSFIPLSGFAQTVQEKMITCLVLTETMVQRPSLLWSHFLL